MTNTLEVPFQAALTVEITLTFSMALEGDCEALKISRSSVLLFAWTLIKRMSKLCYLFCNSL